MPHYTDLITSAPAEYAGLFVDTTERPGYSIGDIAKAVNRSNQAVGVWGTVGGGKHKIKHPTPPYMSAYMALIDGGHPAYLVTQHTPHPQPRPGKPRNLFPPLPAHAAGSLELLMQEHGVSERDLRAAFMFVPGNKQHSMKLIARDGVAHSMVELMLGVHPYLTVSKRPPQYAGRARDTHDLLEEVLTAAITLPPCLRADIEVTLALST